MPQNQQRQQRTQLAVGIIERCRRLHDLCPQVLQHIVGVAVPSLDVGVGIDGLVARIDAVHHLQVRTETAREIRRRAQRGQTGRLVIEPDHQHRCITCHIGPFDR